MIIGFHPDARDRTPAVFLRPKLSTTKVMQGRGSCGRSKGVRRLRCAVPGYLGNQEAAQRRLEALTWATMVVGGTGAT